MKHEESQLQQQCVAWFRAQYPQYAMLLTHPINEGWKGTGVVGGIHKAEGTVAGVPDLLLFMPASRNSIKYDVEDRKMLGVWNGLGIEFKTEKGKQSQSQKDFEHIFTAAGYEYKVVRTFEGFKFIINNWVSWCYPETRKSIASAHVEIEQERMERERNKLKMVINRK